MSMKEYGRLINLAIWRFANCFFLLYFWLVIVKEYWLSYLHQTHVN